MNREAHSSGPRSNAYSESKRSNWAEYDPFFAEARAALKRFDSKLPLSPAFPEVVALRVQTADFVQPCSRAEVTGALEQMPPETLEGLRAVILLAGTRKQEISWHGRLGCYGMYWRRCVFLCARPFRLPRGYTLDDLREFFLTDVLVHEIGHHVDRHRRKDTAAKESYAHAYVERQWSVTGKQARKKQWGER